MWNFRSYWSPEDPCGIFVHTDPLRDVFGFQFHFYPPGDLFGRFSSTCIPCLRRWIFVTKHGHFCRPFLNIELSWLTIVSSFLGYTEKYCKKIKASLITTEFHVKLFIHTYRTTKCKHFLNQSQRCNICIESFCISFACSFLLLMSFL